MKKIKNYNKVAFFIMLIIFTFSLQKTRSCTGK
jgi:hypothetical protein